LTIYADNDINTQGEDVFRTRRSLFFKKMQIVLFKKMQIVRGCDVKRNVLVYMVYSDKLIEGSPKNSTSTVPVMPWRWRHGGKMRGLVGLARCLVPECGGISQSDPSFREGLWPDTSRHG